MRVKQMSLLLLGSVLMLACSAQTPPTETAANPTPSPTVAMAESHFAPCARGTTTEELMPQSVNMVTALTGWASAQCTLPAGTEIANCPWPISVVGIVRTTDGGHRWTDVSPQSIPNRTWSHAQFFLDSNHAWVAEVSASGGSCTQSLSTFSTADGGMTWQQGGTITLNTGPTSAVFNIATDNARWLDFVDPMDGWLLVPWWPNTPSDTIIQRAALYRTTDGGESWTFLAHNPGQGSASRAPGCSTTFYATQDMDWVTATDGWIEIACPAITLLHSTDAGRSWSVESLPNCVCQEYRMSFVDSRHGFMTGDAQTMLATADGGITWEQLAVPRGADRIEFANAVQGWALVFEQQTAYDVALFATIDAGLSWKRTGTVAIPITTTTDSAGSNRVNRPRLLVRFIDAKTAFVWGIPSTSTSQAGRQAVFILAGSTDGGVTWRTILTEYSSD